MKKWYKLVIVTAVISALVNGCAKPKTPEQLIEQSADKKMMTAFSKKGVLSKKEYLSRYGYNINLRREINSVPYSLSRHIASYSSKYDASTDAIARLYVKTAKSRGNIVKLYKNSVNATIARLAPSGSYADISLKRFDLDPAFIEFNRSGRIVSILVRRHYFPYLHNINYRSHDRDSMILIGQFAKKIEMRVGNQILANGYISTL